MSAREKKQFTVEPLITGEKYVFRVAAENEVGVGEFVELSQGVVAKIQHGEN